MPTQNNILFSIARLAAHSFNVFHTASTIVFWKSKLSLSPVFTRSEIQSDGSRVNNGEEFGQNFRSLHVANHWIELLMPDGVWR